MSMIKIEHLKFKYDEHILAIDDVSFNIEKGSYTTIIGHNGSGKSTLAKLLIGLQKPISGNIIVDDITLTETTIPLIRQKVGIVFQNPDNQFIGATVREDIAFGLENHNVPQDKMDGIIKRVATSVKMENFLNHEPTKLSGGQKQRVAIAGVLAMNPDILIFDEATSMLDPMGKKEINDMIQQLKKNEHFTIISITHDMEEVIHSDHVIVMNKGKVLMQGSPLTVLKEKEKLLSVGLTIPFSYKVHDTLKSCGVQTQETLSIEKVVEELGNRIYKR